MAPRSGYRPVRGNSPTPTNTGRDTTNWTNTTNRWHWAAHAGSAVALVSLLVLLLSSNERCWDRYNYYSPVNAALSRRPFVTTRFNGSLWHESPFKGPPTPAVEAAWHSAMRYGMISVTAADYERTGHSVRTAVQFPPEAGGGYMATTVGTHQLHCLHYVWKDHHRAYFPDMVRTAREVPDLYERHYEHCVDYIRQSVMCHFDPGLVTYDWVRRHQSPTPNANAMHKCVDWDAVQRWLRDRAVEVPDGFAWRQPEGGESLPWNP
ncbi:hypothetical protein G6O67_006645 [Ophiocordyceps sinensis]|uniref:Tat pathway signal sequence n=2 Tax=Ophiocordyceps sinensis TaxID=72228 RepID=A0A8H4PMZ4_9HYPO|nr:hypothetical protein OCS_04226 [Ophiocordyceps sinensis CO18]KAF4506576.1 hypothetical protein G6O67_006645 [Ophiocordyceps sinensis]